MSWSPISPPASAGTAAASAAVTLAMLGDSKRFAPMMRAVVRTEQLDGVADWLKPGAQVSVMAGHGDHAGMIRIVPDGGFMVVAAAGRAKTGTVTLRLPIPATVPRGRKNATSCVVRHGAGWVEIELPEWARPPRAAAPYVGISERVNDPVTALRGRA